MKIHSLILLSLAVVLIISPVTAGDYIITGVGDMFGMDIKNERFTGVSEFTFDQSQNHRAITLVHFKAPMESTVYFTLYYGNGQTASGSVSTGWDDELLDFTTTTSTITFNGETKEYSYFDTNPEFDYFLSGYARAKEGNETGIIVYNAGYGGFDNDLAIFKPVSNLPANLIYRVELSGEQPFDVDITHGDKTKVASYVSKTVPETLAGTFQEWIDLAIQIGTQAIAFVHSVLWWIKFLFIDNLLLILALWIGVTMAYSAISSKNIFGFYKKFFRFQKMLMEFIIDLWHRVIAIITSFIP